MAKGIQKQEWYRLDRIRRYDTPYKIIIGERSNGKTYSVKELVQNKYKNGEGKFLYIRRKHDQITRKYMVKLFEDISDLTMDMFDGRWVDYQTESGFFLTNDRRNGERETIGFCSSVEDCYDLKGIPFNEITTIFFDEFLEYGSPLEDEIPKFLHLISTVVRKRENVEIYMIANTVTQFSKYFELFGIDPKKLKKGEIAYLKHKTGVSCAVEYCKSLNIIDGKKLTNKYVGFDNNATSDMILYGEWEYDVCNNKNIDGIGWESQRRLLPIYITALGQCYEMSVYLHKNPIAFVRKPNTQNGFVKEYIKYNLTYDDSLKLTNKNGCVPTYGKINKLVDNDTLKLFDIFKLCVDAKRIVFDTMETGSDFHRYLNKIL